MDNVADLTSIIIPSRVDQYLQKTIDDLFAKAKGEIEIIVALDGYWPDPPLNPHPKLKIIHQGTIHDHKGMRAAINSGVAVADGEYIMKIDDHCMMDEGWDEKLKADCEDDWIVVPRRKRLDAEKWELVNDGRADIDYMYIAYPYERPYDRRCGLYGGGIDKQRYTDRKDILIDDTMSMQGSCYFTKRAYWNKLIAPMDDVNYGTFNGEAQEIHFKVQLSGGRFIVNKKTFYAHWHKGSKGKGYGFSREQYRQHETDKEKARIHMMNFWLQNKWSSPPRIHDFKWLIDKFNPPGWPEDWETRIHEDAKKDWSRDPSKQPSEWINYSQLPELEI